jgi:hypothetical protein
MEDINKLFIGQTVTIPEMYQSPCGIITSIDYKKFRVYVKMNFQKEKEPARIFGLSFVRCFDFNGE